MASSMSLADWLPVSIARQHSKAGELFCRTVEVTEGIRHFDKSGIP